MGKAKWGKFKWGGAKWGEGYAAEHPAVAPSSVRLRYVQPGRFILAQGALAWLGLAQPNDGQEVAQDWLFDKQIFHTLGLPPPGSEGAKQDTVFLGKGDSFAQLAVDLSQYADNFTPSGTGISEPGTRLNIGSERTIAAIITTGITTVGAIFTRGSGANLFEIELTGAGSNTIRLTHNNTVLGDFLMGVTGSGQKFLIAWVTRANPDTTGASDAYRSWLFIAGITTTVRRRYTVTHAATNSFTDTGFVGDEDGGGTNEFEGSIHMFLYSRRCQSFAELERDFITHDAPVASICENGHQFLLPESLGLFADTTELYGPQVAMAIRHQHTARLRLFSPIVNQRFRNVPELRFDSHAGSGWLMPVPGTSTYYWHLSWLRWRRVPELATHLWVRCHIRSWVTGGLPVPIGIRIYSMNKLPGQIGFGFDEDQAEPFEPFFAQEIVTRDDTSTGQGSHVVNALVKISRGKSTLRRNSTYLTIAYDFDPNNTSSNDSSARLKVFDFHVRPAYAPPQAGGLPLGPQDGG